MEKESWSQNISEHSSDRPAILLEFGDGILAGNHDTISYIHPDGKKMWQVERMINSQYFTHNDLLYYGTLSTRIEALDKTKNVIIKDSPLSVVPGSDWYLSLFSPFQDGYLASSYGCSRSVKDHPNGVSEDIEIWNSIWRVGEFGRLFGNLEGGSSIELRQPTGQLYIPYLNQLLFLGSQSLTWIDLKKLADEIENHPKTMTLNDYFAETKNWSSDNFTSIAITGSKKNKTTVVLFDTLLKRNWQWTSEIDYGTWAPYQPPIISESGVVYVLEQNRLLALNNGLIKWQFEAKTGTFDYALETGDGSLFVTNGKDLVRIGKDGKEISRKTFEYPLAGVPLITDTGDIYVSTKKKLYKF